jgi:hypothetical protein
MKINQLTYKTKYSNHCVPFEADAPFTAVVSCKDLERSFFTATMELALYKTTDSPCGPLVTQCYMSMSDDHVHSYPSAIFDKEGNLPGDRQEFRDHVLGQAPFETIQYLRHGQYEKEFNAVLKRLSGGRFSAIKWDSAAGMVVEHQNGVTRSIFDMFPGDLEVLKFTARIVDLRMLRYPFQIVTGESLALLDRDHLVRFATELLELPRQEIQVVFVCGLMDVLCSPLAGLPGMRIVDLDDRQEIPTESEV